MSLSDRTRGWMQHPLARHPLTRRITGYSAGSVVAIIISEAAFAIALGWGHTGATAATAIAFVAGAVPNYVLNRRWAWRDRRGRDRRTEILLYMSVAVATFIVAAFATNWAEKGATHLTPNKTWQVLLVTCAYLGVSALFFVVKFLIYETFVFTKKHEPEAAPEAAAAPVETAHLETIEAEPLGSAAN